MSALFKDKQDQRTKRYGGKDVEISTTQLADTRDTALLSTLLSCILTHSQIKEKDVKSDHRVATVTLYLANISTE